MLYSILITNGRYIPPLPKESMDIMYFQFYMETGLLEELKFCGTGSKNYLHLRTCGGKKISRLQKDCKKYWINACKNSQNYMNAVLPFKYDIAGKTVELVLKYNPDWKGCEKNKVRIYQ